MSDKREVSLDELSAKSNNGEGIAPEHRSVQPSDMAKQLQEKHGVAPKEKAVMYDSYTEEVVATLGKKASDEVFEKAKEIIEEKFIEVSMNSNNIETNSTELDNPLNIDDFDNYSAEDIIVEDYVDTPVQETQKINAYVEEEEPIVVPEQPIVEETTTVEEPTLVDKPVTVAPEIVPMTRPEPVSYRSPEVENQDEFNEMIGEMDGDMDEEEAIAIIRTKLKEKIKPITDKIDLNTFVISNDPVSIFKAFDSKSHDIAVADWALYDSGIPISVKEMRGYDIEKLNPGNSRRNEYNTYKEIYMTIYEHVVNEDKPTFEEFIRLIRYSDKKHLFFAIYRASFNQQNMLAYTCEKDKCNEIFVEEVDTDEMYKFKDKETEDKFNKILNDPDSSFKHKKYESVQVQISEDYVISVKEPSIFNVIFEMAALDDKFKERFASIIGILSYVDNIYQIDRDTNTLRPIELKTYENNLSKTVKYRIFNYAKIIQSLTSDQFYNITAIIGRMTTDDDIKYIIPERTCPKCKSKIEEYEQTPENMLFTRHQLVALANI